MKRKKARNNMIEMLIIGIVEAVMLLLMGIGLGCAAINHGFRLGFKASYEIRKAAGEDTDNGLFPTDNDPAEFDLLKEDKGVT